jgi:hypothetical protein
VTSLVPKLLQPLQLGLSGFGLRRHGASVTPAHRWRSRPRARGR